MKKIVLAVPKGRISNDLIPLLEKMDIKIENDFFDSTTRKLYFKTNYKNFEIIRVRSFDVATFVAFGAAQIGVAGNDILQEFHYNEIYSILDLNKVFPANLRDSATFRMEIQKSFKFLDQYGSLVSIKKLMSTAEK